QTYFETNQAGFPKRLFYPSKRNGVITTVSETQAVPIFKSDGKTIKLAGPLAAQAAKLRSNQAWVAVTLDDAVRQQLLASASGPGVPGGGAAALGEALKDCTALTAWASVQGGNLDLHFGLECTDAAVAQQKVT